MTIFLIWLISLIFTVCYLYYHSKIRYTHFIEVINSSIPSSIGDRIIYTWNSTCKEKSQLDKALKTTIQYDEKTVAIFKIRKK